MAITTGVCNSYKQEIINGGVHTSADVYKVALFTSSATLSASTTVYSTANEVVGIGYTAGGATLTGFTVSQSVNVTQLDFNDISWTGATITARGAMIYNSSKGNKVVAVYDFGGDIGGTNITFNLPITAGVVAFN